MFLCAHFLHIETERQELVETTSSISIDVNLSPNSVVVFLSSSLFLQVIIHFLVAIDSLYVHHEFILCNDTVFVVIHVSENPRSFLDLVVVNLNPDQILETESVPAFQFAIRMSVLGKNH